MRLQTTPIGAITRSVFEAFCFSTDTVGDVVYIMGDKVGDKYQVTKVDIDNITTMPAIGIITRKITAGECEVQTGGLVQTIYTGLVPNKVLFVGTDSRLTINVPSHKPTPGRRAVQVMGQVLSSSDFFLHVRSPIILVT